MADIPKKNRFTHQQSTYERPVTNSRCCRDPAWGKPCARGPGVNGVCQGVSECRPFKNGNRWLCRRPQNQGGTCAQGPNPDGSCCNTRAACAPVPTVRRMRGQLAIIAAVLAIAAICLTLFYSNAEGKHAIDNNLSLSNPGELSDMHHAFSASDGCQTCHLVDDDDNDLTGGFINVAARQDLQAGCVTCHEFGGPASAPHNMTGIDTEPTSCIGCHTEHKGRFANLIHTSDQQCASCHESGFESFADHVAFGDKFPNRQAGSIVFNHTKHMDFHFKDKKNAASAPATCTDCHRAEGAGSRVEVSSFEEVCSSCHLGNIVDSSKSEMDLLELPKLKLKSDKELAAFSQCGAEPGEKFKSAGGGKSNSFLNWLLNSTPKKKEIYAAEYCELIKNIEKSGINAVFKKMKQRGAPAAPEMFTGMGKELLNQVSQTWASNERYRPPSHKPPKGLDERGWFVTKKGELKYKPLIHGDPVVIAWVNFAQKLQKTDTSKLAKKLSATILSDDKGAGSCTKCHNQITDDEGNRAVAWEIQPHEQSHRFVFNHDAHLSLVGARNSDFSSTAGCAVCHKLNAESDYADVVRSPDITTYQSNFHALSSETCAQCHNESNIQDNCQMCHQYHDSPSISAKVSSGLGEKQ